MQDILTRLVNWAEHQEPIRALILEGSRATGEEDELSDYDVNVFLTSPSTYSQDDSWIYELDEVCVYIPEKMEENQQTFDTRLVIFRNCIKIDFILYSTNMLEGFRVTTSAGAIRRWI